MPFVIGADNVKKLIKNGIKIRTINAIVIVLAVVFSFLLFLSTSGTLRAYEQEAAATEAFYSCERAANDLMEASNYLTTQVRMFAITLDPVYAENFIEEQNVTMRREDAISTLRDSLPEDSEAIAALEEALKYSNDLINTEYYSIKLGITAENIDSPKVTAAIGSVQLSQEDLALSQEEKIEKCRRLVTDDYYKGEKTKIIGEVERCIGLIESYTEEQETRTGEVMSSLLARQRLFTVLLLAVIVFTVFLVIYLILMPLTEHIKKIKASEPLPERGASELRYLSRAYNDMYEETRKANESLRHAAEHDALTRLYNRRAFDALAHQFRDNIALMILDVDGFKGFNDTYGHDVGDKVLQKVARLLKASFRFSDYICRFGGDEFTIIMTEMSPELKNVIEAKVALVRKGLFDTSDGLPKVTLSIGVSFGNGESADEIFKAADTALYDVKDRGRNGMSFNVAGEIIPVK